MIQSKISQSTYYAAWLHYLFLFFLVSQASFRQSKFLLLADFSFLLGFV